VALRVHLRRGHRSVVLGGAVLLSGLKAAGVTVSELILG
jgi:hypothetical protein